MSIQALIAITERNTLPRVEMRKGFIRSNGKATMNTVRIKPKRRGYDGKLRSNFDLRLLSIKRLGR